MLAVKRVSPLGFFILAVVVVELFVLIPKKTEDISAEAIAAVTSKASLSIQGFSAVSLNHEGEKEIIKAKEAEVFRKEGYAVLKDVEVRIFSKGDHTIFLTGNHGKYFMNEKNIELFDNILVVSENLGYRLQTNYLKFEESKDLLTTHDEFVLKGPNPDQPSLEIKGKGIRGNTKTEEMQILSNVHCKKYDTKAESIDIDSDEATLYLKNYEALFSKNVVVNQKKMNIFTDNFLVNFNASTQSIDKAKAYPLVKIVEDDRVATCETAFLLNREQKIVMRGNPKVVQGNDVVEGKIIIFFTAENKILFDEAVGEVEVNKNKLRKVN